MTPFETPTAFPLDRQVDAWLARLRAEGYSARQLEHRAGVLGQWAAGRVPDTRAAQRVVAAFEAWQAAHPHPSD